MIFTLSWLGGSLVSRLYCPALLRAKKKLGSRAWERGKLGGMSSLGSTGTSCVLPSSFFIPMGMADSGTAGAAKRRGTMELQRCWLKWEPLLDFEVKEKL